jgi:sugar phosphate permease
MARQGQRGRVPRLRWNRIVPIVFLMYTISYMDRVNISVALPSMGAALHLNGAEQGLASGIFFWGYLVTFILASWLVSRTGTKRLVLGCLIAWGLFAIGTGAVQGFGQLIIVRICEGLSEGAVWTAVTVLLANWFPAKERGRAFGLWNLCIPTGALAAAPLAGWLIAAYSWRIMFFVEGAFAWVWVIVWYFGITDRPARAPWVSSTERDYIEEHLASEQELLAPSETSASSDHQGKIYLQALKQPVLWVLLASFSLIDMADYGFAIWLPSALKELTGLGIASVGLLTALPYVAALIGLVVIGWSSDRFRERKLHTGIPMILMGLLLYAGVSVSGLGVKLALFILVGFVLYMYLPLMFTLPTEILPAKIAAATVAIVGAVGNLFGGFVGPTLVGVLKDATGNFSLAFDVMALFAIIAGALVVALVRPRVHTIVVDKTSAAFLQGSAEGSQGL